MMMLPVLVLGMALQQPAPHPAPQHQSPPARPAADAQGSSPSHPLTPYDSTVGALSDVGTKVAEVRSTYELYRRAAFNDPNGALLERAALYRTNCRTLAAATRQAEQRICRHCLPHSVQPTVDQYRAHMPALRTVAEQCVTRIDRLKARGDEAAVAAAMRADARAEGDRLAVGLRPYEARVADVRKVMGWDQQPATPTPRRSN
jgi:hypothetical protein